MKNLSHILFEFLDIRIIFLISRHEKIFYFLSPPLLRHVIDSWIWPLQTTCRHGPFCLFMGDLRINAFVISLGSRKCHYGENIN